MTSHVPSEPKELWEGSETNKPLDAFMVTIESLRQTVPARKIGYQETLVRRSVIQPPSGTRSNPINNEYDVRDS